MLPVSGTSLSRADDTGRTHVRMAAKRQVVSDEKRPRGNDEESVESGGHARVSAGERGEDAHTGYKRRLALACQLARNPKVLCLDEPLAGLDWKSRSDVAKVLGKLKRERLILVVTHDVEEMKRIADFAYRVKDNGKGIEEEIGLAEGFGANTDLLEDDALKSEFSEFT